MAAPTAPQGEGAPPEAGGAGGPQHHSTRGRPFTLEPTDGTFTLRHLYPGTAAVAPRPLASRAREQIGDHPAYRGSWGASTPPRAPPGLSLPNISQHERCQGCSWASSGSDRGSRLWLRLWALWATARVTQHGQPNAGTGGPKPQGTPQAPTRGIGPPSPVPIVITAPRRQDGAENKAPKGFIPPPSIPPSPFHAQTRAEPRNCPEHKKRDKKRDIGGQSPHPQHHTEAARRGTRRDIQPRRAERPFPPSPGVGVPTVCLGVPPPAQGTRDTGQEGTGPGGNSGTRGVI